jgi:hypothetical protein
MQKMLRPDKTRVLLIVSCWAFLSLLCLFLAGGKPDGVKFAMFLGAIALTFAARLYPCAIYLKLTAKGFEYKYFLPARFVEWNHVYDFATFQDEWGLGVSWNYSIAYPKHRLTHSIQNKFMGVWKILLAITLSQGQKDL